MDLTERYDELKKNFEEAMVELDTKNKEIQTLKDCFLEYKENVKEYTITNDKLYLISKLISENKQITVNKRNHWIALLTKLLTSSDAFIDKLKLQEESNNGSR